jgi:hypothetical protein
MDYDAFHARRMADAFAMIPQGQEILTADGLGVVVPNPLPPLPTPVSGRTRSSASRPFIGDDCKGMVDVLTGDTIKGGFAIKLSDGKCYNADSLYTNYKTHGRKEYSPGTHTLLSERDKARIQEYIDYKDNQLNQGGKRRRKSRKGRKSRKIRKGRKSRKGRKM